MWTRNIGICGLASLLFALGTGCNKTDKKGSKETAASRLPIQNDPVCTVHWLGMKRLGTDPNAAGFLKIWGLPETQNLKASTLDKLAVAPWSLSRTNLPPAVTNFAALVRANASASLLRPLLDDLVQHEFYLEVRESTSQPAHLALAVRLDPGRASIWETNLGTVMETSTGNRRVPIQSGGTTHGWRVTASDSTLIPNILRHVELSRAGEWTVIGFGAEANPVFSNLLSRIQKTQNPFVAPAANSWLETILDLQRVNRAFSWGLELPEEWPRISFTIQGDGKNLVTRGNLKFPNPLPFQIEPWNIPTNLIHEPLHSFTAVQGIKPWLASWQWWQHLQSPATPNQLFCWAQIGSPFLDYAAAPTASGSKVMAKLGPGIMVSVNSVLATNRMGRWEHATDSDGVVWSRSPIIAPFVHSVDVHGGDFIFGGLAPVVITNTPTPAGTLRDLLARPNIVYFDREITSPRVEAWLYISQLFRIIFRRDQLPTTGNAVAFLKAIEPLLGSSETTLVRTSSTELALSRTSTLGLTSFELNLLADWLESTKFPIQLHSIVAKSPPPRNPARVSATTSKSSK
jgi:hypothetical protein